MLSRAGRWYIDSDTNHANGYFAYATTSSWNPPEYGWAEYCDDAWMAVEDAVRPALLGPSLSSPVEGNSSLLNDALNE